jgi:hypothetical protein
MAVNTTLAAMHTSGVPGISSASIAPAFKNARRRERVWSATAGTKGPSSLSRWPWQSQKAVKNIAKRFDTARRPDSILI